MQAAAAGLLGNQQQLLLLALVVLALLLQAGAAQRRQQTPAEHDKQPPHLPRQVHPKQEAAAAGTRMRGPRTLQHWVTACGMAIAVALEVAC
jgi:hypothetical protein